MLIGQPEGINFSPVPGGILIERRWYSNSVFFQMLFTAVWNAFIMRAFFDSLFKNNYVLKLVLGLFVLVGLQMIYQTLCHLLNTTKVRIENSSISISHGPIPVPGVSDLSGNTLQQIYVREKREKK